MARKEQPWLEASLHMRDRFCPEAMTVVSKTRIRWLLVLERQVAGTNGDTPSRTK